MSAALSLQTDRLHLRMPVLNDSQRLAAMVAPEAVHRHLGGPQSPEESWSRFVRGQGCWQLFDYGPFVVERASDGRFVGSCGLFRGKRGLGPAFDNQPEAGWVVAHWAWGRGYAHEAMAAILDWFDGTPMATAVVAMIEPENAASLMLARRLGFRAVGSARYHDQPVRRFRRPAPEAQAQRLSAGPASRIAPA